MCFFSLYFLSSYFLSCQIYQIASLACSRWLMIEYYDFIWYVWLTPLSGKRPCLIVIAVPLLYCKLYFMYPISKYWFQIFYSLCRKWDIILQKWDMPRCSVQGSSWWSLLSCCFNVYSPQWTKLHSQVQLWSWFWMFSRGFQWTANSQANDWSSLSWFWQSSWKWRV